MNDRTKTEPAADSAPEVLYARTGIAFLPEPTIAREVAAGTLAAIPLASDELVRPLGILHRRGKELGVTVRRFIEFLRHDAKIDSASAESNGRESSEMLVAS